jgi:outer membrane protein TolC
VVSQQDYQQASAALGDLAARRGDLRAVESRMLVSRKAVRDSWIDFLPYLTAVFQPFFQDPPSLVQPQTGWQLQLLLTVPLYDGGLRYGQQRERRAQLAVARAQLEGLARQARSEVRAAFVVLQQADKALSAAREAARLGQEAHGLANKAYQAGATTSLEIIDAARRARDAETAAVVAEDAARQARLDLLVASGRFP